MVRIGKTKCYYCDETEPVCLDWHHIDPNKKSFSISGGNLVSKSIGAIKNEITKCVCICSNCHRKFHTGLLKAHPHPQQFETLAVQHHLSSADSVD